MGIIQDYKSLLQNLIPIGRAWNTDPDSNFSKVLDSHADELAREHNRALDLARETNPASTNELLEEWVSVTAIEDDCAEVGTTAAERQAAVLVKLASQGGANKDYFIRIANLLGIEITIDDQFQPFRAGYGRAGDPCYGPEWIFYWQVNAPEIVGIYFRAGYGRAGDPLVTYGGDFLECILNRLKPAHTNIIFNYAL